MEVKNSFNRQVTLLKFYLYKIAFDFKEDRIHAIKYILTTYWRVMDSFIILILALVTAGIVIYIMPWYVILFIIYMVAYVVVRATSWTRKRL